MLKLKRISLFTALLASLTVNTSLHATNTNTVRPSKDGYVPISVPTSDRVKYKQEGFSFDRINRSYIYSEPHSKKKQREIDDTYKIKSKEANREQGKYPMIILLHANNQNNVDAWNQTSLPEFAYSNDFYLVAPNASNRVWNDGTNSYRNNPNIGTKPDDVGFLIALTEVFTTYHDVDPRRIYIVGIANGGVLSKHFACRTDGIIAGGGSILATMNNSDMRNCNSRPTPWISINGGDDNVFPYMGHSNGQDFMRSAEDTFIFFSNKNQCLQTLGFQELPNYYNDNPTRAYIKASLDCHNNTDNVLISIRGGGHQIPNIPNSQKNKPPFNGLINKDLDTGTAIFNFILNQNNKF